MAIHVSPTTQCNLGCSYCYEEPDREVSDVDSDYDIDAIMSQLKEWKEKHPNESPGMHGGEPLLMNMEDLEKVFSFAHEHWGSSHIQTNGTLMTEEHVEMFDKYDVHVGVSKDGPKELNRRRLARSGGEDTTDLMSEKTQDAIETLIESDVSVGIIVVLHKYNAGDDEKLEKLLEWIDYLNRNGVSGHYNPAIPYEDVQADESLSPERLKEVYLRTWEWMKEEDYREWDPMRQYQDNLLGNDLGNCVNSECDVFNAKAAKIVKGDGSTTGCGKTWSTAGDGNAFLQGDATGNEYEETKERYEMLKQTPGVHGDEPDQGGCKGCKFWDVCRGGCPSSGLDFDYRNRTRWCKAKYALYEKIEKDMKRLFPGIRLVSDLPEETDVERDLKYGKLDLKPFAGMSRSTSSDPSVKGGPHDEKELWQYGIDHLEFEEKVEAYKERFGEENVTYDKEKRDIHADTSGNGLENNNARSQQLSDQEFLNKVDNKSPEERERMFKERFGEENVTVNSETGEIHADSSGGDESSNETSATGDMRPLVEVDDEAKDMSFDERISYVKDRYGSGEVSIDPVKEEIMVEASASASKSGCCGGSCESGGCGPECDGGCDC